MTAMPNNPEAEQYYQLAVIEYIVSGIELLLGKPGVDHAGLIMVPTCCGIDCAGGIVSGFHRSNVGQRFTDFMVNHMHIDEPLASYVYQCHRCGMLHEGAPKAGAILRAPHKQEIFVKDAHFLYVNVDAFGRCFVDAARNLPDADKQFLPPQYESVDGLMQHPDILKVDSIGDFTQGQSSHSPNDYF